MAAATLDIPSICLNVGPMLNGYSRKDRIGSGTVVWQAREKHAAGEIDDKQVLDLVTRGTTSAGHCNTMGTASTMNALAEALGMALPGSAAIPAPYRERAQSAYKTGVQIVEMVYADRKPSDIMTREAFENAVVVNTAIGGSTNAPIHIAAIARHIGVELPLETWQTHGHKIPLLVNLQPAGEYLGEDFYRAGGVPAVVAQLMGQGLIAENALTVNGQTIGENCRDATIEDERVTISRAGGTLTFPACFQLIAAANPCPCGHGEGSEHCRCPPDQIRRYESRLSGPLADRIDVRLSVEQPAADALAGDPGLATVQVSHHLEELAASVTHALLLRDGRVVASGPAGDVLLDAPLSRCFAAPVRVVRRAGRSFAVIDPGAPPR